MLDQALGILGVVPDHDLDVMRPEQSLNAVTAAVVHGVGRVIVDTRPDLVLVQGDTISAMGSAVSAFNERVAVGHVEAGLRTGKRASPYPEEMTRRIVTQIAELHFAPTTSAADNLLREHADLEGHVFLTGNTVVDAVREIAERATDTSALFQRRARRMILMTAHRRENFGEPIRAICRAVRAIVDAHADVEVAYPVHLNPNIQRPVTELLAGHERIHLLSPLEYDELVALMGEATLILSDSGGLQEEAPVLGKPVVVLRRDTERPEAIAAGTAVLAGTDEAQIVSIVRRLLTDSAAYERMAQARSPFGDGHASKRIADIVTAWHAGRLSDVERFRWRGTGELAPYPTAGVR